MTTSAKVSNEIVYVKQRKGATIALRGDGVVDVSKKKKQ